MPPIVTPPPPAPAVVAPKVDAPAAAAPVEVVQPVVAPSEGDLSNLSLKELSNLQRTAAQRKPVAAPAPKPAEVVRTNTSPVAAEVAKVDEPVVAPKVDDKPVDEPANKPPQYRLRGRDAQEDAFLALVSAGRTVPEATAIVYPAGAKPVDATTGAAETEVDDSPILEHITRIDGEIKTATTELEKLDADLSKAAAESDLEAVTRINREITRKERAIDKLNGLKQGHESDRTRVEQQAIIRREKADHDLVVKNYPELGDKNSPEYGKFMTFFRAKEAIATAHPRSSEAAILALPNWRSLFVREFAEQEGIVPAHRRTAKPAVEPPAELPAPPPKVERPQASAAKVLTTSDQPAAATFEITPADVEKRLAELSPKQLGQLMREKDQLRRTARSAA